METLSVFRFRESRLLYNLVCYCRNSIGITIPAAVIVIQSNLDAIVLLQVKVLYVRNLKSEVTEEQLKEKFEAYGKVERVKKIKDYGFIHFEERDSALRAMEDLNGAVGVGRSWMFCGLNSLPSLQTLKFVLRSLLLSVIGLIEILEKVLVFVYHIHNKFSISAYWIEITKILTGENFQNCFSELKWSPQNFLLILFAFYSQGYLPENLKFYASFTENGRVWNADLVG